MIIVDGTSTISVFIHVSQKKLNICGKKMSSA